MARSMIGAAWEKWGGQLKSLLRIAAAMMFTEHGMMKLIGFPAPAMPGGGTVPLFTQIGLAAILETFGGALLLIGWRTRIVAFILSGEMAVAFFQAHFPRGIWPVLNGGELAVLYSFLWLYFSAAGPGPWSVDAMRERRRL